MSLTSENLVGYMRAEFAKSGRIRVWLFFVQLAAAVPAAVSVVAVSRPAWTVAATSCTRTAAAPALAADRSAVGGHRSGSAEPAGLPL